MDRYSAAGSRHGVLSCHKEKQPFLDFGVKRAPVSLHLVQGVPASLCSQKNQDCKAVNKSYGGSTFSQAFGVDWMPSSSRILASRYVNTSTNSNRTSENQVMSSNTVSNTINFNERKRIGSNLGKTTISQPPSSINSRNNSSLWTTTSKEGSSKLEESSSISTANDNRLAGNSSCADAIMSSSVEFSNEAAPHKGDDQNEDASLSPSLTDEMFKPGPLMEIHNHVSGKNGCSLTSEASLTSDSLSHLLASGNIIEFISRFPGWADAQKESGMPQRQKRGFYSHEDWLRHRSSLRYVRHVLSSFSSRVIVSLVPPVFTLTAGATGVAAYNTALKLGYLPSFLPLLHAASLPYELTAPALALLLVFRTDASYSRYDEARKTWTSVISTTKDLARLSAQLIKSSQDMALKSSLLRYIMAFPVSLKCHLIHGSDTQNELQRVLEHDDLEFVLSSDHRPNCLIQLISQSLDFLQLETAERVLLGDHVRQYVASVSACERLIRTPIPLSYTRLTSRFLVLWHMSLPIVLWDTCNWLVVPATFFSAATLFCIEEVGVLIEEPFPMLALDKIISVAHDNIWEMMKRQKETDDFLSLKRTSANK